MYRCPSITQRGAIRARVGGMGADANGSHASVAAKAPAGKTALLDSRAVFQGASP